jgi:hypothetical protein
LTIHAVHFYGTRISLFPVGVINGSIVRYLDVGRRVLLEGGVNVAQKLRAVFDSDRGQIGVMILFLECLLELVLHYLEVRKALRVHVVLRHGCR